MTPNDGSLAQHTLERGEGFGMIRNPAEQSRYVIPNAVRDPSYGLTDSSLRSE
jgi:hypothetical protein